jgi:hypothetical protein
MVEELPQYLALRVVDEFTNDYLPFNNIISNAATARFVTARIQGYNFTITIRCGIDKYFFSFWDEDYNVNHIIFAEKIINYMQYDDMKAEKDEFGKGFKFPDDEKKLYEFIKEFKEKLKSIPISIFE